MTAASAHDRKGQPRRILAFDGGGIRGIFSLQIAARIESLLRDDAGREDLVLADAFDMFAGTSTGAIIATCLSWGMAVEEIERLYLESGASMFLRAPWWRWFHARYRAEQVTSMLQRIFTEPDGTPATLGSSRLRTLLLVVMRNATTGSAWPLTNNPRAMFNDPALEDCNLRIPIWQLLRASTAAPTLFPPQQIQMGSRTFAFMDGAITPYNNPALVAVLTATLPQYRIGWPAGWENLLLVSIGTGGSRVRLSHKPVERLNLIDHLAYMPPALLSSIGEQQDAMCRLLGRCRYGEVIDAELGDLCSATLLSPPEQKFSYVRYNMPLPESFTIDDPTKMDQLREVGRGYAREHVDVEHLRM